MEGQRERERYVCQEVYIVKHVLICYNSLIMSSVQFRFANVSLIISRMHVLSSLLNNILRFKDV